MPAPLSTSPPIAAPAAPTVRRFAHRSNIPRPGPALNWNVSPTLRPAMNQGNFNTCTAFALCATMSDLKLIQSKGKIRIDLSPGHLHWCLAGLDGSDSLDTVVAMQLAKNQKIALVSEQDYPYDTDKCDTAEGYLGIRSYSALYTGGDARAALQSGPVLATMHLYAGFENYTGGVYRPPQGLPRLGNHTVELVGYDDGAEAWIIKNSAGPDWGENGFARIAYETCGIFTQNGFYAFNVTL